MPQSVRCKEYSTLCSPNQCSIQATKTNCTLACYKIIQPNPNSELIQPNQGAPFQYQLCFDCVQQRHNNDDCGTCCIKSSDMFILVIHLLALEDQGGASADFCQTALPSQYFHFFVDTETRALSNFCHIQCTIGQGPLKRADSDLQPLILSASKYFRQISLSFHICRDKMNTYQ